MLQNSLICGVPIGTKRLCHQRKRWVLQNSLMRALQGPSSSVTRGNGERYRIPWCVPYRDQAALSPEETVSVTEFLDACLTGTKQLCHQRKRWVLQNSLMHGVPTGTILVSVTELLDMWCAYRDQAALSPEETVSVTIVLFVWAPPDCFFRVHAQASFVRCWWWGWEFVERKYNYK